MKCTRRLFMMILSMMMVTVLLSGCEGQVIDRKEVLVKDDAGIKVTLLKDRTHTSGNELRVVLDIEDTKPGSKIVTAGLFDNANHTAKVNGVDIPVQSYTITTGMPGAEYAKRTWITVKIDDLEAKGIDVSSVYEIKTQFKVQYSYDYSLLGVTNIVTIKLGY